MAMTKKEREAFDAALKKAEILGALRWTTPVAKDVPPPAQSSDYSQGFEAYSTSVQESWSGVVTHGDGKAPTLGARHYSASQRPIWLYSTRLLALRALRHKKEIEAAEELRKIDLLIAKEEDDHARL